MTGPAIDLTGRQPGWPDEAADLWVDCVAKAVRDDRHSRTPPRAGLPELRELLGGLWAANPARMVLTTGVRAAAALLTRAGDRALVEAPGFAGIPATLRASGAEVVPLAWEQLASTPVEAADTRVWCWLTSSGRNPDGARLPPELAGRIRARLVANDIYRPFDPDPPPATTDYRVGSLAKVAGGGSRLGWVVAPAAELAELEQRHVNWPATLSQLSWLHFLSRGGLEVLRPTYVTAADAARTAFVEAMGDLLDPAAHTARGPAILLATARPDAAAVLRRHGILAGPGSDFLSTDDRVRLCFSDVRVDEAVEAARRVTGLARQGFLGPPAG